MDKNKAIVILGTAHLRTSPGKCSPDRRLREAEYSRTIVRLVQRELEARGYGVLIDYLPLEPSEKMRSSLWRIEQKRELNYRSGYVNDLCDKFGSKNCLYVSIHVNGIGNDGQWHDARGWSVWTSPGRTRGDKLADCLWEAADAILPHDHRHAVRADRSDGDPDYEANLHVLSATKCAAALTENYFQDNKADVDYLLSDEGKEAIVRVHVEGIIKYIDTVK